MTTQEIVNRMIHRAARVRNLSRAQIAQAIGYDDERHINRICSQAMPRYDLPAHKVGPLSRYLHDPELIRHIAAECGGMFVERPVKSIPVRIESLPRITRQCAALLSTLARAMEDGRITRTERAAIAEELDEIVQTAAEMRQGLVEADHA